MQLVGTTRRDIGRASAAFVSAMVLCRIRLLLITGLSMGAEGMRMSLVSREVIADSIELVARGNHFDGLVVLVGCDKTIPGAVMALARLNIPGMVLYGGSIAPGRFEGRNVTIQDVF